MPLIDYNDPQAWLDTYRLKKASDPNVWADGFVRDCSVAGAAPTDAGRIITALGLNNAHRIAFIGAGYGWIAKAVADQIGAAVVAIDTSTIIQAGKAANADIDIYALDLDSGQGRATVRQVLGIQGNNPADYAITEDVITVLSDQECIDMSAQLHILATTVVHWSTMKSQGGSQDPRFNWKTPAEWKALLPNDLFIQRSGDVVL